MFANPSKGNPGLVTVCAGSMHFARAYFLLTLLCGIHFSSQLTSGVNSVHIVFFIMYSGFFKLVSKKNFFWFLSNGNKARMTVRLDDFNYCILSTKPAKPKLCEIDCYSIRTTHTVHIFSCLTLVYILVLEVLNSQKLHINHLHYTPKYKLRSDRLSVLSK